VKAVGLFAILFLACGSVQGQSLRVLPVQIRGGQGFPAAIQFYCTEKYIRTDCQNDISTLTQKLGHYSLEKLGSWSFVLAASDDWESIMNQIHLPADSPVFSALKAHLTVMSQTLFSGPADRRAEMMRLFRLPLDQLVDLAITHEFGHALCQELDEGKATVYGEQLRAGQTPTCEPFEKRQAKAANEAPFSVLSAANAFNVKQKKDTTATESSPVVRNGPQ
jgi:hypothetical protein